MGSVALYVASVVAVNWLFTVLPLVPLGEFGAWPPASLAVGVVFVVRDFAQRAVGHGVIIAMLVAAVLSWFMASPYVAVASVTAFAVSELVDWLVYTLSKASFRQRVLYSSALSTPLDSAVFLLMIGHFSWVAVILMTLSKMVVAVALYARTPAPRAQPA